MSADARSLDTGAIQYRGNMVGHKPPDVCVLCAAMPQYETWRCFFAECEKPHTAEGNLNRK